ncbi:hypothetical protein D3C81_1592010 [compost metagenome]
MPVLGSGHPLAGPDHFAGQIPMGQTSVRSFLQLQAELLRPFLHLMSHSQSFRCVAHGVLGSAHGRSVNPVQTVSGHSFGQCLRLQMSGWGNGIVGIIRVRMADDV